MARNSHSARVAKRAQHRAVGSLPQLLAIMWHALGEAQDVLDHATAEQAELRLKAVHAIIQAGSAYAKLLEIGELEARLAALEAAARGQAA
jgi:hypothetical protein